MTTITISIPQIVINISNNSQNLNLEQMAHTLDELLQLATEQSTKEDSLFAIMDGLKKQVADAIANAGSGADADAIQAEVDAVFEKFSANTQKMADAITANTPAPTDGGTTPPVVDPAAPAEPTPTEPAPADGTDTSVPPVDGGGTSTDPVPTTPDAGPTAPDVPTSPDATPTAPTTNADGVTVI